MADIISYGHFTPPGFLAWRGRRSNLSDTSAMINVALTKIRYFQSHGHIPGRSYWFCESGRVRQRKRSSRFAAGTHCTGLGDRCASGRQASRRHVSVASYLIRETDPSSHGGLFDRHQDRVIRGGVSRTVPHDLLEEPRRDNDRQNPGRARQRLLGQPGFKKAERQVNRGGRSSMRIVVDLSCMQRQPQPDPLRVQMPAVMPMQRADQRGRQRLYEQALGHFRADQDEHAVAAILMIMISPLDTCLLKCFPHRPVQTVTNGHLIPVSALTSPEPLNVKGNDGPVDGQTLILHLSSRREQSRSEAPAVTKAYLQSHSRQTPGATE